MESTPDDVHPQNILEDYVPLTKGNYPVFNKYPTFIVDYQVKPTLLSPTCSYHFKN